jgi:predicted nucleic-acid-binding Zn-ribbon protein
MSMTPDKDQKNQQHTPCPMCGGENATLDHWNGGWTEIECQKCGGGLFYLWVRGDKPCTKSLKICHPL